MNKPSMRLEIERKMRAAELVAGLCYKIARDTYYMLNEMNSMAENAARGWYLDMQGAVNRWTEKKNSVEAYLEQLNQMVTLLELMGSVTSSECEALRDIWKELRSHYQNIQHGSLDVTFPCNKEMWESYKDLSIASVWVERMLGIFMTEDERAELQKYADASAFYAAKRGSRAWELHDMTIDRVREIAAGYGIKARSKDALIREILGEEFK